MLALQLLVNGILLGGTYVLIAQSLNLIFGVMGVVKFCTWGVHRDSWPVYVLVRHPSSAQSVPRASRCGGGDVRGRRHDPAAAAGAFGRYRPQS